MLDQAEYSRWVEASKNALNSAKGDEERGDYNWACFKAQQAAEFAVKGLLHGIGSPAYGHSISRLLSEASENFEVPESIIQAAKTLDKHYVPTRYPNVWAEGRPEEYYTKVDSEEAVKYANLIIEFVERSWRSLKRG